MQKRRTRRQLLKMVGSGAIGCLALDRVAALGDEVGSGLGLRVLEGSYWLRGRQASALGVNYFDCFMRTLADSQEESSRSLDRCEAGFRELSGLGIPFVRFNAGGFYPKDWRLYEQTPQLYFEKFKRLVQMAESYGMGLVPSLFWTFFTQPGRSGEPLAAWGDASSRTHRNMRRYVEEVVGPFRNSSAVWAWEFGNEYNLEVDLPNQANLLRKWFHPSLGMPPEPGARDILRSQDVTIATRSFAAAVRAVDRDRAIFTGHACPRTSAWHLEHDGTWGVDSRDQWCEALKRQNPRPFDALSMHFYPFHEDDGTGPADARGEATLQVATEVANRTGQPLWVGEFGASPRAEPAVRLAQFRAILKWLEKHSVALAAAWVYDYPAQPENNLSAAVNRPLLEALSEASSRWKTQEISTEYNVDE